MKPKQAKIKIKQPSLDEEKKAGRPTKYLKRFDNEAYQLCLLGATNESLSKFFNVTISTLYEWMEKNPPFSEAIKAGREVADAKVANALFNRALGYKHKATKMQLDRGGKWQTMEYTEVYPPDPTAAIFWLKNRRPDQWREKLDIEQKTIVVKVEGEEE